MKERKRNKATELRNERERKKAKRERETRKDGEIDRASEREREQV